MILMYFLTMYILCMYLLCITMYLPMEANKVLLLLLLLLFNTLACPL